MEYHKALSSLIDSAPSDPRARRLFSKLLKKHKAVQLEKDRHADQLMAQIAGFRMLSRNVSLPKKVCASLQECAPSQVEIGTEGENIPEVEGLEMPQPPAPPSWPPVITADEIPAPVQAAGEVVALLRAKVSLASAGLPVPQSALEMAESQGETSSTLAPGSAEGEREGTEEKKGQEETEGLSLGASVVHPPAASSSDLFGTTTEDSIGGPTHMDLEARNMVAPTSGPAHVSVGGHRVAESTAAEVTEVTEDGKTTVARKHSSENVNEDRFGTEANHEEDEGCDELLGTAPPKVAVAPQSSVGQEGVVPLKDAEKNADSEEEESVNAIALELRAAESTYNKLLHDYRMKVYYDQYEIYKSKYSEYKSNYSVWQQQEWRKYYAAQVPHLFAPGGPFYQGPMKPELDRLRAREESREARIKARIAELKAMPEVNRYQVIPLPFRRQMLLELRKLQLAAIQRRLRSHVLKGYESSNAWASSRRLDYQIPLAPFFDPKTMKVDFKTSTADHRLELMKAKEARMAARHRDHLASIMQHREAFSKWHADTRSMRMRLCRDVLNWFLNAEKRTKLKEERAARERMKALKENDEEGYRRLLEETKNERLTLLLHQTDEYLSQIVSTLKEQKKHQIEGEEGHDDVAPKKKGRKTDKEELVAEGDDAEATSSEQSRLVSPTKRKDEQMDYYFSAHSIQEDVSEQPEGMSFGTLKEYQLKGLSWLVSLYNNSLNGILADEMGLGKTIQTLALFQYLKEKKNNAGPFLIVVPLSTIENWRSEAERWTPDLDVVVYNGKANERKLIAQTIIQPLKFNVCLTTFEYVIRDKNLLTPVKWNYIVVDEGHRMKNKDAKLTLTLGHQYRSMYRLVLTGTPLQNNLPELWSLLNFLLPKIFNSPVSFAQWFNTPFANTGEKAELSQEEQMLVIKRLHKVLRPFLLRRLKTEVLGQLPPKVELLVRCEMSALQRHLYERIRDRGRLKASKKAGSLRNCLMQLRKVCCHPYLFPEYDHEETTDHIFRCCGKFELLDRVLPKLRAANHRVLIFSQFTSLLTVLEDYLNYRGLTHLRLDGSTSTDKRRKYVEQFESLDSPFFAFLLSTKAGGLGLNLQAADTVIIFDSDWNPHADLQAQDRAHRIGQKNEVRVLRLVTVGTVEENMWDIAQSKLDIDQKVIQAGKFDTVSNAKMRDIALAAIMRAADDRALEESLPTPEELNAMLARSETDQELFERMDAERDGGPLSQLLQESELPEELLKDTSSESEEMLGRGGRERKDIVYDDNLTEDQFLKLIEEGAGHEELDEAMREKRKRRQSIAEIESPKRKRARRLSKRDTLSEVETVADGKRVGRPRRSKRGGQALDEDDGEADSIGRSSFNRGKMKKKGKAKGKAKGKTKGKKKRAKRTIQTSVYRGMPEHDAMVMALSDLCQMTDDEDRFRIDLFMDLPDAEEYPDYYSVITAPIAMDEILEKVEGSLYPSYDVFEADLRQMIANARTYNEPGSMVYVDATIFADYLDEARKVLKGDEVGVDTAGDTTSKKGEKKRHEVDSKMDRKRARESDDDEPVAKRLAIETTVQIPNLETLDESTRRRARRSTKRGCASDAADGGGNYSEDGGEGGEGEDERSVAGENYENVFDVDEDEGAGQPINLEEHGGDDDGEGGDAKSDENGEDIVKDDEHRALKMTMPQQLKLRLPREVEEIPR